MPEAPTPVEAAAPPSARDLKSQPAFSGFDYAAGAIAFLVPIGFSTAFTSPFWTPKAALLLLTLPFGVGLTPRVLRGATFRPALAGLAFVGVAGVSTAFAGQPDLAFFGAYSHGIGFLFIAALFSVWALGTALSERGRVLVETALLASVMVNVAFSLVQPLADLSPYGLGLLQSRTPGLMGNPVHLSALLTGAYALAAARGLLRPGSNAMFVVGIAAGIQLSGSRFSFLAVVLLALALLGWKRNGPALLLVGLTVVGLAAGQGINAIGHGVSGTTRIDEGLGGNSSGARVDTWRDATAAISERPIFGHGPGRYLSATAPHRSLELAKRGPEKYFRDAHNIVVEWATTVGLVGVGAFGAWVVLAALGARGPLLWFAGGVLLIHLVQPLYVGTTPLAFLALGAAVRPPPGGAHPRPIPPGKVLATVTAVPALVAAVFLVSGESGLQAADLAYSPTQAEEAMEFLPDWPEPRAFTGVMEVSLSITERDPARFEKAIGWFEAAVEADPEDPRRWNQLGGALFSDDRFAEARAAYEQALERNPLSLSALTGVARTSIELRDEKKARTAIARAGRLVGETHPALEVLRSRLDEIGAGIGRRAGQPARPPLLYRM